MSAERRYPAHEALVAPARKAPQIWRLVMGLVLIAAVYLICNRLIFTLVRQTAGSDADGFFAALANGTTPLAMLALLGSFGFITLGVAVAAWLAHARGFLSVLGDPGVLRRQFARVFVALLLLHVAVALLPPWSMGPTLELNMAPGLWLLLLPFTLLAILIQVTAEEVLFRGYLQQHLAARFGSPLAWMVLPAALFGAGHYMPVAAGENAFLIALWAGVFGVLMADLTARAGTLGPAFAVHFLNNLTAIAIVSLPGELSGLALFLAPFSLADTAEFRAWLPVDFAMMFLMWLAARLALRR